MTLVILIAMAALLAAGSAMIFRSLRANRQADDTVACAKCGDANPRHARFCSQCGAPMA